MRKAPREPGFPVPLRVYAIQQLVVAAAVLLEEQAQVMLRLLEHAGLDQHQHDQPPAPAAAMDERLQLRHAVLKVPRRRRHEVRIPRSGGADPVLAAPELHLTWAPAAERQAIVQARQTMLQAGHFDRVSLRSQGQLARLACFFPLLRSLLRLRVWANCGSAFQADDAGSIPAARSNHSHALAVPLPSPARICGGLDPAAGHRPARLG